MLGGKAVKPASFLPIGVRGSTEAIAKEIGFHQDLDRAKSLLQKAGMPDGFEFELSYGNATIAGILVSDAGAEDAVRPWPGRDQGEAEPDGPGQPAHPVSRPASRSRSSPSGTRRRSRTSSGPRPRSSAWPSASGSRRRPTWSARQPSRRRARPGQADPALGRVPEAHGRPGQPDPAVPAGLPGGGQQHGEVVPATAAGWMADLDDATPA